LKENSIEKKRKKKRQLRKVLYSRIPVIHFLPHNTLEVRPHCFYSYGYGKELSHSGQVASFIYGEGYKLTIV
jgi:hypothetical protein